MARMRVTGFSMLVALSLIVGVGQAGDDPVQLKDVKIADLPQGPTVTVETSGPPRYQATVIDSPTRLVIDMNGSYAAPRMRWAQAPAPIREIRGSQWKPTTARLVVELTRPASYRIQDSPTGLSVILDSSLPARSDVPKAGLSKGVAAVVDMPKADGAKRSLASAEAATAGPRTTGPTASDTKTLDSSRKDVAQREAPASPALWRPDPAKRATFQPEAAMNESKPEPAGALADVTPVAPMRVAQATPSLPQPPRPIVAQAPPSPPTPSNGNKLITLDFKDADVTNVLRILAAEGGRNIVVGDDVKGKVTVSLRNVTWEQALDTILEARGLQRIEKGGVIRVVSNEQLAKEREAQARAAEAKNKADIEVRTKLAEAQMKEQEARQRRLTAEAAAAEAESRGPLREEILRVSYADPGEIASTLQSILGLGTQPIEPCVKVTEDATETKIEFRTGGGAVSGPIAEPPFSQLFGPPRTPEQTPPPPPVSVSQDVLARGLAIRAHCSTNSLFLRLYATDLDRVKRLIRESLDVPLPQVKIEARMEILDRTALEAIGVQWSIGGAGNVGKQTLVGRGFGSQNDTLPGTGTVNVNPANSNLNLSGLLPISPSTGLPVGGNLVNLPLGALPNAAAAIPTAGLAFGIVGTQFNINLALQALASQGKTRTLARPEIVTVENHKAKISLGEEIPYATVSSAGTQIQFKEALLKLEVIPMVIRDRGQTQTPIKLFVVVENNSRGDVVNLGASGQPPAINKRMAKTQVLMNEGERLVIGGVTTGLSQNTIRKVPLMGDIPVLGWLFKQREEFEQGRELVVFLTPSVLRPSVAGAAPAR